MPSPDLIHLWQQIIADLQRARGMLPVEAVEEGVIREYQEFLDHNELELACDMLEVYAETHAVPPTFWTALRDAATNMRLNDRAARYAEMAAQ